MRRALVLAAVLLVPAFAGCASKTEGATDEPLDKGGIGEAAPRDPGGTKTVTPTPTRPKSTSERWHFHDYWQGSPVLELVNTTTTLNASADHAGLAAEVRLPPGVIVPAETGFLNVSVRWETPGGVVNVSYKPADSNDIFHAAWLPSGGHVIIDTTESMCDVPHRQESLWKFLLIGGVNETAPGLVPRDVQITITATIGRPLFIDPPHLDWWQGGDVIPLVQDRIGEVATAATPAGNATLGSAGLTDKSVGQVQEETPRTLRLRADDGRIVPEGAQSVVAMLNWTSSAPAPGKLLLRYRESNYPSEGALTIAVEGEGSRIFMLPVTPGMTDTTYSNRTTWEFEVVPEGGQGAFAGTFTFHAWVTRLAADVAVAAIRGDV